jgi:hypothetical protein
VVAALVCLDGGTFLRSGSEWIFVGEIFWLGDLLSGCLLNEGIVLSEGEEL